MCYRNCATCKLTYWVRPSVGRDDLCLVSPVANDWVTVRSEDGVSKRLLKLPWRQVVWLNVQSGHRKCWLVSRTSEVCSLPVGVSGAMKGKGLTEKVCRLSLD